MSDNMTKDADIDLSQESFEPVVFNVIKSDGELWFQLVEGIPEDEILFRVTDAQFTEEDFLEIKVETMDGSVASDTLYHYAARIVVQGLQETLAEVEE